MASTRSAAKRSRLENKRRDNNRVARGVTKAALRDAMDALKGADAKLAQTAYAEAVRTLAKAGSKGQMPARRAARKISRLTRLAKKIQPSVLAPAAQK